MRADERQFFWGGSGAVPKEYFTGRRDVLQAFGEIVREPRAGLHTVWVVEGRRGFGKSSLARFLTTDEDIKKSTPKPLLAWFEWNNAEANGALDWDLYRGILKQCPWITLKTSVLGAKSTLALLRVYNTAGVLIARLKGVDLSKIEAPIRTGTELARRVTSALKKSHEISTVVLLLDDADRDEKAAPVEPLLASCRFADQIANAPADANDVNIVVVLLVHPAWQAELSTTANPARHVSKEFRLAPLQREDFIMLISERCTLLGWEAVDGCADVARMLSGGIPHIMGAILHHADRALRQPHRASGEQKPRLTGELFESAIWTSQVVHQRVRSELLYRGFDPAVVKEQSARSVVSSLGSQSIDYRAASAGLTEGEWRAHVVSALGPRPEIGSAFRDVWDLLRQHDVVEAGTNQRFRFCAEAVRLRLPPLIGHTASA